MRSLTQLEALASRVSAHPGRIISAGEEFNASWRDAGECLEYLDLWHREAVLALATAPEFPVIRPAWLSWSSGIISKLAQAIQADQAFERLPVLADALEEAGCTDAAILAHCRGPGPHVRGCWVVDLLLGKT